MAVTVLAPFTRYGRHQLGQPGHWIRVTRWFEYRKMVVQSRKGLVAWKCAFLEGAVTWERQGMRPRFSVAGVENTK
jgi:hypothetical protein